MLYFHPKLLMTKQLTHCVFISYLLKQSVKNIINRQSINQLKSFLIIRISLTLLSIYFIILFFIFKSLLYKFMSITPVPNSKQGSLIQDFLSGGVAGIISKTVVAPVERVKLLMQTQVENKKLLKKYTGVTDCLTRCIQQQGVISLWRGNWVNVVRYFPTQALSFSFKDFFNSFFNIKTQTNQDKLYYLLVKIMNGGLAGSITTLFVHPLDFARTRIGVDLGKSFAQRQFTGLNDCLKKTWTSEGIVGLYRGVTVSVPSIFLYRGLYFGIYDTGRDIILPKDSSMMIKFFWAQASVIFSEFVSYPGDTVKRKLMMQSLKQEKQYTGVIDCFKKTYKNQGLQGFWKGAYSNILRSVGSSLCLILYDEFRMINNVKKH